MNVMTNDLDIQVLKREFLHKPAYKVSDQNGSFAILKKHLPSQYHFVELLRHITTIIYKMSETPWCTQQEILEETRLEKRQLMELNRAIRESDFLQKLIVYEGLGRRYWGTVMPLMQSGAVDKTLNGEYQFPTRLGIYPGMSCMFHCGFCGRNEKASYPNEAKQNGNEMFKKIFASMPKNVTLSISGGLEPLTNTGIGDLISNAKKEGIRVPLITNGYNLTPQYINKQQGLFDLNSLRVSLYGVDEESYNYVTRKKGAYRLVENNVVEFLKKRNVRNPDLQVGLNYVVLPENLATLNKILDVISDINSKVDNGPGVDFLSIREDFGSVTGMEEEDFTKIYKIEGLLSEEQRASLIKIFKEFNHRKEEICPDLDLDFGYAIAALNDGVLGRPLVKVDGTEMRQFAYPQISVAVDSFGDVFLYREAGFLNRHGNEKFIAGRISPTQSLEDIVRDFIENPRETKLDSRDSRFMDAFDHLVTQFLNKAESDRKTGIPFELGPVRMYKKPETELSFGTIHQ